jgi:hypothetical protein
MSSWYGSDEDPFTKVGYARVIVIRHNPSYNFHGQKDNCTIIMHVESFATGFACNDISKSRYGSGPSISWLDDEVRDSCEHKINHLFKNKPNGIYELIGDIYHWSSQSYEGEWDGESEIRETGIQQISFDHAMYFECESMYEEMRALLAHSENRGDYYNDNTDIHPYMTKHQILVNHANALTRIIDGYGNRPCFKDSKIEDIENCIHMLMLQIDSEKQNMQPKALEIDKMAQEVLKAHAAMMEE